MSDTYDVPNAPLVFICSDSLPSNSLFWLAKSTMANRTISPMYMPLIIFSNLKNTETAHFRHRLAIVEQTISLNGKKLYFFFWRLPLLSRVQRVLVDFPIVFRADGVQFSVVTERTPFGVDDHVRFRLVAVEEFGVFHLFHVTRVAARSCANNKRTYRPLAFYRWRVRCGGPAVNLYSYIRRTNTTHIDDHRRGVS